MTDVRPVEADAAVLSASDVPEELPDTSVVETVEADRGLIGEGVGDLGGPVVQAQPDRRGQGSNPYAVSQPSRLLSNQPSLRSLATTTRTVASRTSKHPMNAISRAAGPPAAVAEEIAEQVE